MDRYDVVTEVPEMFTPGDIFSGGYGGLYILMALRPYEWYMLSLERGQPYANSFAPLKQGEWPEPCEPRHTWTYVGRLSDKQ